MLIGYKRSQGSIILRVKIRNSSISTGAGLTGLSSSSTGMIIAVTADNEQPPSAGSGAGYGIAYTVAGSTIETITTLGTYESPTATKCRFKEVDATNHRGVYEIQIADARFGVSSSKSVLISVSGATDMAECDCVIALTDVDPYDATRGGMTALPNAAAEAAGGLFTRGTGAGQINQTANGMIDSNIVRLGNSEQSATDQKDFADNGYDPATHKTAATIAVGDIAADAITGDSVKADAVTKIQAGLASSSEVTAIQNNTRTVIVVPTVIERTDSGTDTYKIHMYLYDEAGNMEAPDSAPTVALVNSAGTDRSSRLGSTTGTLIGTGHYSWTYTNTSTDTMEQLLWEFSVVEGGATRLFGRDTLIVDTTAVDFTSADRTVLQAAATAATLALVKAKTDNLPASPAATGDIPTAAAVSDAVWDEALSGHLTAGSAGKALSDAGNAGDPWSTTVPGAYGAGTAGYKFGNLPNSAAIAADLAANEIVVQSPFDATGRLTIVTGDSYLASNGTSITSTITGRADLIGLIPHLIALDKDGRGFDVVASAVVSGTETLTFGDVVAATTLLMRGGPQGAPVQGSYQIRFLDGSGNIKTGSEGVCLIRIGLVL